MDNGGFDLFKYNVATSLKYKYSFPDKYPRNLLNSHHCILSTRVESFEFIYTALITVNV